MIKNESGRSMVEMLGVLAIIGVLSVGGIAGYTYAMRKYKANELLAAAAQCGIVARSTNGGEGITQNTNTDCGTGTNGLKVSYNTSDADLMQANYNGTEMKVTIKTGTDKNLCEAIVTAAKDVTDDCDNYKATLAWS